MVGEDHDDHHARLWNWSVSLQIILQSSMLL